MLWYEDRTLKVTLSLSFLEMDEKNKWTVLADAAPQVRSMQSSANNGGSLLVVEWRKLIFPRGNERTVFPLTTYRGNVVRTRCKVKKLFPFSCKFLLCFINLQMSHTFIVLYK